MDTSFIAAVKDMREKQKAYFRFRDSKNLTEAKRAEKNVDDMIKENENSHQQQIQKNLFEE